MARSARAGEDLLAFFNDPPVDKVRASRCIHQLGRTGSLKKGAKLPHRRLRLREIGTCISTLSEIDGCLTSAWAVGKMANHTFPGTHADVEIDADCRPLATRIILSPLPVTMGTSRLAINGHIEQRAIRNSPDRRDHS